MTFAPRDLRAFHARLADLAVLPAGWLDADTPAPSKVAISAARHVLTGLLTARPLLPIPPLFPCPDGSVQAEWIAMATPTGDWAADVAFDHEAGAMRFEASNVTTRQEVSATPETDRELADCLRLMFAFALTVTL